MLELLVVVALMSVLLTLAPRAECLVGATKNRGQCSIDCQCGAPLCTQVTGIGATFVVGIKCAVSTVNPSEGGFAS